MIMPAKASSFVRSRPRWARPARRNAFTLIELLVVVAIIALLISILLPSLHKARTQARRTLCLSNMHQIAVAIFSYQADYRGRAPRWSPYREYACDGMALWVQGDTGKGHATRLGMLYPSYVGRNENVFYCPDAATNALLNKDPNKAAGGGWAWTNFGTNLGWAYGAYEYRPHFWYPNGRTDDGGEWVDVSFDKQRLAITADAFAGSWDSFGPYPAHTPIQGTPKMLYYNVGYTDGSANPVKDFIRTVAGGANEFWTRAAAAVQQKPRYVNASRALGAPSTSLPPEYTPLTPAGNEPLSTKTAADRIRRDALLKNSAHIDRAWTYFERK
jgi:prepilin-type N-terminal cleavage/methylation domain-containing protein